MKIILGVNYLMKLNKNILSKGILTTAIAGALVGFGTIAANADTVTVQSGQTVSQIAQEYNTTIDEIQQLNNLDNPNLIYVGQQLKVNNDSNDSAVVQQSTNAQAQVSTQQVAQQQTVSTQQVVQPKVVSQSSSNEQAQSSTKQTANVQVPVQQNVDSQVQTTNNDNNNYNSNVSGSDAAAKAWIAEHESGDNYNARNGQYVGKYQLSSSYLNGDYSPANQDRCADQYVAQRYGSWTKAQQFWEANGWY